MSLSSKNKIRVVKFQSGFFSSELFADIFNTDLGKYDTPIQLIYLDNYLKRLSVKTLVIESHYIDRHFIHEFQNYYSTCLIPPVNYCFRIHAFDVKFTVRKLNASLKNNDFKKDRFFDKSYIGFIIIRPVSYAPVGRVMIPKLQDQPERMIKAVFNKTIHLLGIELKVEGLPFMQQDRRVSACATVAIWSCLSKVCNKDGQRAPTPSEISRAAFDKAGGDSKLYPQSGLTVEQMCCAISVFGFSPDLWSIEENESAFKIILSAYLKSDLPVILIIANDNEELHAVTCCGLSKDSRIEAIYEGIQSPLLQWKKLYFHDDRLGPYARGETANNCKELKIQIPRLTQNQEETWTVQYMLVALYPKIRTTAYELFLFGTLWIDTLCLYYKDTPRENLSTDFYFERSGEVMKKIRASTIIRNDKQDFIKGLVLSRYVGIVNIYIDDIILFQFFLDTTDRLEIRSQQNRNSEQGTMDLFKSSKMILGMIINKDYDMHPISELMKHLGVLVASK